MNQAFKKYGKVSFESIKPFRYRVSEMFRGCDINVYESHGDDKAIFTITCDEVGSIDLDEFIGVPLNKKAAN